MYKVLKNFQIPGFPEFEEGQQYASIPDAEAMQERGLVEKVEEKKVSHETKSKK